MSTFARKDFQRETGMLLRGYRNAARLTQQEVADALEMKRATYANIESGRVRVPADVVWRIAILVGKPVRNLLPAPVADTEGET